MYGSSFWMLTEMPRLFSSLPSDDAAMPLPSDETTPPVKKMYFVIALALRRCRRRHAKQHVRQSGRRLGFAALAAAQSRSTCTHNGRNSCTLRFRISEGESCLRLSLRRPVPRLEEAQSFFFSAPKLRDP